MTQQTPLLERHFWSVTWPIMFDVSLGMSLAFTDFLFLGRVSDAAAGAIGGILPILLLAEAMYFPLGQGCTSVVGKQLGAGQRDGLGTSYGVAIMLASALGVALAAALASLHAHVGAWLGFPPPLQWYASQYLLTGAAGFFFVALYKVMASLMRCHGNTRWAMVGALIVIVVNILLNVLLAGGVAAPGLSPVQGVALATVSASCAGMCWMLYGVFTKLPVRPRLPASLAAFTALARPILRVAVPGSLEPINFHLSQIAIMSMIVPFGALALSTRTYVQTSLTLVIVLEVAVAIGTQIYIAHLVGARRFDQANRLLHQNLAQTIALSTALNLCLFMGAAQVLSLFTHDRRILDMAVTLLMISLLWEPAKGMNLVIGFSLRAVGDAKFSSTIGLSLWLLACPLAYLFGVVLGWGLPGIWAALAIDENVRAFLHYRRWRNNGWRADRDELAAARRRAAKRDAGGAAVPLQQTIQKG